MFYFVSELTVLILVHLALSIEVLWCAGACDPVDRALHSRSEGLGFDSQCWLCVEVSGKLHIPHCLGQPSRNWYLVHRSKVGSIVAGYIGGHFAWGKVKSVEHALSWSLDSNQLLLPLPLNLPLWLYCCTVAVIISTAATTITTRDVCKTLTFRPF